MQIRVTENDGTPIYAQIVRQVKFLVASGRLSEGERLPSVRRLAEQLLVNPNTVARAYRDLEALGAVKGQNGRGVFVTEGALEIASRERWAATLTAFKKAAFEALRTGHTLESLLALLQEEAPKLGASENETLQQRDSA